jgi:hypothetical protein
VGRLSPGSTTVTISVCGEVSRESSQRGRSVIRQRVLIADPSGVGTGRTDITRKMKSQQRSRWFSVAREDRSQSCGAAHRAGASDSVGSRSC